MRRDPPYIFVPQLTFEYRIRILGEHVDSWVTLGGAWTFSASYKERRGIVEKRWRGKLTGVAKSEMSNLATVTKSG